MYAQVGLGIVTASAGDFGAHGLSADGTEDGRANRVSRRFPFRIADQLYAQPMPCPGAAVIPQQRRGVINIVDQNVEIAVIIEISGRRSAGSSGEIERGAGA